VIGESGFEAQAGPIIVSSYSGVCFEIKFSGRHTGFDGVLFNENLYSPHNSDSSSNKINTKLYNKNTKNKLN